jgi:hypothetical protein
MPTNKIEKQIKTPPGEKLRNFIEGSQVAKEVDEHIGLSRVIDDHQILWSEARSKEEKIKAHKRFKKQAGRTLVSFWGFEIAVHGLISVVSGNFLIGGSMVIFWAILINAMRRWPPGM